MSLQVARKLIAGAGYLLELEREPSSHADVAMKGSLRSGVWEMQPVWGQEWRWAGGCCEGDEVHTEREEREGTLGPSVCPHAWPYDPLLSPSHLPNPRGAPLTGHL